MIGVFDFLLDISLAVLSAAATGAFFALLIGQLAIAQKHIARRREASRSIHAAR